LKEKAEDPEMMNDKKSDHTNIVFLLNLKHILEISKLVIILGFISLYVGCFTLILFQLIHQ